MIRFAKAHAYGNDFLYVEQRRRVTPPGLALASLAREICDRHTGVGADGLIVYGRTAQGATMRCSMPMAAWPKCPGTAFAAWRRCCCRAKNEPIRL